ncbi:ribonuclease HII [Congzhengia sp.]|uniref:ribonuclease HII n=1 Tax=Congzhengia sp. TaxID=2944168 RepID=UPI00307890C3
MTLFEFDQTVRAAHHVSCLAGVDEAGRGPLAGPVFAAAVILPPDFPGEGIRDSKKLSEKKREALEAKIKEKALAFSVCAAEVPLIEEVNILNATFIAMKSALAKLTVCPEFVLVDGNRSPGIELSHDCIVGGDNKSLSVAAASILAKVARDRFVKEVLAKEYPQYQFEKHKGYGTKLHFEKIAEFGPCPQHRRSFLKKKFGEFK